MKRLLQTRDLVRVLILTSMATMMVAGFLVLGGLNSGDSAEAFRCSKRWFDRCPNTTTTVLTDDTVSPVLITTGTLDGTSTGGLFDCDQRWFNRCSDFTTTATQDFNLPE